MFETFRHLDNTDRNCYKLSAKLTASEDAKRKENTFGRVPGCLFNEFSVQNCITALCLNPIPELVTLVPVLSCNVSKKDVQPKFHYRDNYFCVQQFLTQRLGSNSLTRSAIR